MMIYYDNNVYIIYNKNILNLYNYKNFIKTYLNFLIYNKFRRLNNSFDIELSLYYTHIYIFYNNNNKCI